MAKGGLVILMVLYHCASVSKQPETDFVRHQIQFLHYAFLLLTGFVCGWHYESSAAPAAAVRRRLRIRAFKLASVFFVTNCAFGLMSLGKGSLLDLLLNPEMLVGHFLLSMDGDYAAYEILWYIAAFLAVAGGLARSVVVVPGMLLLIVLSAVVAAPICQFMAHGALGMLIGKLAGSGKLAWCATAIRRTWWVVALLALAYFMVVGGCFSRPKHGPLPLWIYAFETGLWSCAVILVLKHVSWLAPFSRLVALAGTYSLFCYLVQMPVARITSAALNLLGLQGYAYYTVSIISVGLLTALAAGQADELRRRHPWFDRTYVLLLG